MICAPHALSFDAVADSSCTLRFALSWLDFTQNLREATDAITLGRRHPWLASEGFSLSAANVVVRELPATLYHGVANFLAYAA